MKAILEARFILWKKTWWQTLAWLFMPLVITYGLMNFLTATIEDARIPIAIVDEDQSELTQQLIKELQQIPNLEVTMYAKQRALYALENQEVDSVFILKRDFERQIRAGKRNQLVEAYATKQSYFYFSVKENVTSLVQRKATQAKAALEIKKLLEQYDNEVTWSFDTIVAESMEREQRYALFTVDFSYGDEKSTPARETLLNPWAIWAFFTLLATFFIMDWLVKELSQPVTIRFLQAKLTIGQYLLGTIYIYFILMLGVDLLSLFLIEPQLTAKKVVAILSFRLICVALAALLAFCTKTIGSYYVMTPLLALGFALIGGAFVPIDRFVATWPLLGEINPVYQLLHWEFPILSCLLAITLFFIIYRKELR